MTDLRQKYPSDSMADAVRLVVSRMTGRISIADRLTIAGDLGLDAADRAELIMAVELACHMDLPASKTEPAQTVGDLIAIVGAAHRAAEAALHEAIKDLAAGATATGQTIDLGTAASVLAEEHPQPALDPDSIAREIERELAAAVAPSLPGDGRQRA